MNIILAALNSKYIHTPLALWYLKSALDGCEGICCHISDRTVNDSPDRILADIFSYKPDVVCFSVYIWNVALVRNLAETIRKKDRNIKIVLGGPEVSFGIEPDDSLLVHSDYIIKGEGEFALLEYLLRDIKSEGYNIINELDTLPSPYMSDVLKEADRRIIYFESSRGCPFSCSYCLSPSMGKLRYFSINRVLRELDTLLSCGAEIIKFVDRTFNADTKRAAEIIRYIMKSGTRSKVHFEVVPELLDDTLIGLLNSSPPGMFMLEAGIQSTSEAAARETRRNLSFDRASAAITRLIEGERAHVHLDLIAGLPGDTAALIRESFNAAMALKPHELQLGTLKFLKGARLTAEAFDRGYIYNSYPPYEMIKSPDLTYEELSVIKDIAAVVDRLYNSKLFLKSLAELSTFYPADSFRLFEELAMWLRKNGFFARSISGAELARMLIAFAEEKGMDLSDTVIFDWLSMNLSLPSGDIFRKHGFPGRKPAEIVAENERLKGRYPGMKPQEILKLITMQDFNGSIYVFLHDRRDPLTGRYLTCEI